jgi:hypothetical protein
MSMDVKVQSFESFTGPFYSGQVPREVVLLITNSPEGKGRVRFTGINVSHNHVNFIIDVNRADKQALELRLSGELAESGGIVIVWDGSLIAQGVVGPGNPPGPGPVGIPDSLVFAHNVLKQGLLDAAGQRTLQGFLDGGKIGGTGNVG